MPASWCVRSMNEIPSFKLFSESYPEIIEHIQRQHPLRQWNEIGAGDKQNMFNELVITQVLRNNSRSVLASITYLNRKFMLARPGKHLYEHKAYLNPDPNGKNSAAYKDFEKIFVHEKSQSLVFEMLSMFAKHFIDDQYLAWAEQEEDDELRAQYIRSAYSNFDRLKWLLDSIFKQFGVNMSLTRNGFVPIVDKKIQDEIYQPVLKLLSDPKWKIVNADLEEMFNYYHAQEYPEVIAKASNIVHRFLQILVGEDKNGKGGFGKLFERAKRKGITSDHPFSNRIIRAIEGFISEERANKSLAKPSKKQPTSSDALIAMHIVMVFLQHCLQNTE